MNHNVTLSSPGKVILFPRNGTTRVDASLNHLPAMGAIETAMRATLATLKDTAYQDIFDWSIYDQISARFKEPPRGGVVFNTTFKLVNHHSSCSKCHYAFEIDTYGRGCFHDCSYCYAKDQLTGRGYWNRPQPFPVNLADVRKTLYTVFETDRPSKWRDVLSQRIPLRIGSMSDAFMYIDSKNGVTKELLRILSFYNYPHIIFTRSDLVAHDDYLNVMRKDLAAVQLSIVGNNHNIVGKIEPGAPSYKRRLKALEKLNDAGFWTTVRINPLFPTRPDGYYSAPEDVIERFGSKEAVPVLELYDDNFISEIAATGTPSVLVGFVRLSKIALNRMSATLGVNLLDFFNPRYENNRGREEAAFSNAEISYYYRHFAKICAAQGIRFSTCYIGNGAKDYFAHQGLWTNSKKDCCDVLGNVDAFKQTSQSISWESRISLAPNKADATKSRIAELEIERELEGVGSAISSHSDTTI